MATGQDAPWRGNRTTRTARAIDHLNAVGAQQPVVGRIRPDRQERRVRELLIDFVDVHDTQA
jgi:hypothetical protein